MEELLEALEQAAKATTLLQLHIKKQINDGNITDFITVATFLLGIKGINGAMTTIAAACCDEVSEEVWDEYLERNSAALLEAQEIARKMGLPPESYSEGGKSPEVIPGTPVGHA